MIPKTQAAVPGTLEELDTGIENWDKALTKATALAQSSGAPDMLFFAGTEGDTAGLFDIFDLLERIKAQGLIDDKRYSDTLENFSAIFTSHGHTNPAEVFANVRASDPNQVLATQYSSQSKHPIIHLQELVILAATDKSLTYNGQSIPDLLFTQLADPVYTVARNILFHKLITNIYHSLHKRSAESVAMPNPRLSNFTNELRTACDSITKNHKVAQGEFRKLITEATNADFAQIVLADDAAETIGTQRPIASPRPASTLSGTGGAARASRPGSASLSPPSPPDAEVDPLEADVQDQISTTVARILTLIAGPNALSSNGSNVLTLLTKLADRASTIENRVEEIAGNARAVEDAQSQVQREIVRLSSLISGLETTFNPAEIIAALQNFHLAITGTRTSPNEKYPPATLEGISAELEVHRKALTNSLSALFKLSPPQNGQKPPIVQDVESIMAVLSGISPEISHLRTEIEHLKSQSAPLGWTKTAKILAALASTAAGASLATWLLVRQATSPEPSENRPQAAQIEPKQSSTTPSYSKNTLLLTSTSLPSTEISVPVSTPKNCKVTLVEKTAATPAYLEIKIENKTGLIWLPEKHPKNIASWKPETSDFSGAEARNVWNLYEATLEDGKLQIKKKP